MLGAMFTEMLVLGMGGLSHVGAVGQECPGCKTEVGVSGGEVREAGQRAPRFQQQTIGPQVEEEARAFGVSSTVSTGAWR